MIKLQLNYCRSTSEPGAHNPYLDSGYLTTPYAHTSHQSNMLYQAAAQGKAQLRDTALTRELAQTAPMRCPESFAAVRPYGRCLENLCRARHRG